MNKNGPDKGRGDGILQCNSTTVEVKIARTGGATENFSWLLEPFFESVKVFTTRYLVDGDLLDSGLF